LSDFHLPRGRTTDALIAFIVAAAVVQLLPAVRDAAYGYSFSPLLFLSGGWRALPMIWLSPLVSQFLLGSITMAIFNAAFMLIVGRFVEKALGGVGLIVTFVAGAYGGAIARTVLTPGSMTPTAGIDAGFFATVGAYLMLYGVPNGLGVARGYSRPVQILGLALLWAAIQGVFMLVGPFEISVSLIDPLGGLLIGALIAQPLLRWRYRKA
jgi:membrane associated rhomboid family serine protease